MLCDSKGRRYKKTSLMQVMKAANLFEPNRAERQKNQSVKAAVKALVNKSFLATLSHKLNRPLPIREADEKDRVALRVYTVAEKRGIPLCPVVNRFDDLFDLSVTHGEFGSELTSPERRVIDRIVIEEASRAEFDTEIVGVGHYLLRSS